MHSIDAWKSKVSSRMVAILAKRNLLLDALDLNARMLMESGEVHLMDGVIRVEEQLRAADEDIAEMYSDLHVELCDVKQALQQPVLIASSRNGDMMVRASMFDCNHDPEAAAAVKKIGPLLDFLAAVARELTGCAGRARHRALEGD